MLAFVNNYLITGRQILDSRGNPTIESELKDLENKIIAEVQHHQVHQQVQMKQLN